MEELPHLGRPLRVIGRYALYGKLAAGGMATVHFGRLLGPAGFSRTVAIKRLHPQFAKDPEFVAMFLDEARLAARIQHPNVVATVDVVAMAEELFLVMDYIRGESFSRLLKASRKKKVDVPLGIVASVATGMLHGLHAAHEAKDEQGRPLAVVHRDVSPQNVLVGADGVPRVLDFGVAKAAARIQVTRDGQMKGKLSYMAPEQLKGQGVDRRTDVFAAGIVLWEALTGRRLFDAEQPQEVLRMIVSEEIPPPSAVVPSIPRGVDAVVMKALTRDVTQRFQTARQFAIALEEVTPIASSREVGEWVERVAGDTLQHREQAVAEIEAISSISDVSALSAPVLGITSTLVGQPPPPPPPKAADWDDGPTRIYDSSAAVEAGLDKATQIQVPKPSSPDLRRSSVPGAVPKAARVPSRRPPPKPPSAPPEPRMFPPPDPPAAAASRRPPLPPRAAKPAVASPRALSPEKADSGPVSVRTSPGAPSAKRASLRPPESGNVARPARSVPPKLPQVASFDDENEKTIVRDGPSDGGGFDDENEKTIVRDTDAVPTSSPFFPPNGQQPPPAWDDEGESTTVLDKSGDELVEAAERLSKPPRLEIPVPRPAAGAPPPGPSTVILADHTNPAMLRPRPAPWVLAKAWLSGTPAASARRLGIVASVAGLLVAVAIFLALGKHPPAPAVPVSEVPHAESPPPVATVAPSPPEPRGIDPSMLPPAPPDEPAPHAAGRPDPEGLTKAIAHETKSVTASLASAGAAAPEPMPVPTEEAKVAAATAQPDDDLASPYEKGGARTASPKAEKPPPAAPKPEPAAPKPVAEAPKAPAKAPAQKTAAGPCAQPFTIDENGIKRIKPECL